MSSSIGADPVRIAVCVKWVPLRTEVDPLSGAAHHDPRSMGLSEADRAALELGLSLAETFDGSVTVCCAGPSGAEAALREALAAGAQRAVRVPLEGDDPSALVAAALAPHVAGHDLVVCGDWSLDRGSGSVPAFLAAELGVAQALGLVGLAPLDEAGSALAAERRLDRGRRELLEVPLPAVVSVEGSVATLRRASLAAVLAARDTPIELAEGPVPSPRSLRTGVVVSGRGPYRPRARFLADAHAAPSASARDRILALTGALVDRTPPRVIEAEPDEAAEAIVEQLRSWGYVE